jgi:hypothetical protein
LQKDLFGHLIRDRGNGLVYHTRRAASATKAWRRLMLHW